MMRTRLPLLSSTSADGSRGGVQIHHRPVPLRPPPGSHLLLVVDSAEDGGIGWPRVDGPRSGGGGGGGDGGGGVGAALAEVHQQLRRGQVGRGEETAAESGAHRRRRRRKRGLRSAG